MSRWDGQAAAAAAADLWDRALAIAGGLRDGQWEAPTPCAGWRVHDVLAHLSALQRELDGAPRLDPPPGWPPPGWAPPAGWNPRDERMEAGVAARRQWSPQEVIDELQAARDGHLEALRAARDGDAPAPGPLGETTIAAGFVLRCYDLWVHLQDLHLALGEPVDASDPSPGAAVAHQHVIGLLPWLYAKRAQAPEGATMRVVLGPPVELDDVLVVSGGRARWDDAADPGGCAVQGDPAALTLLVSGRGTPASWHDAGLLSWSGARGEEFVARARLFAAVASP